MPASIQSGDDPRQYYFLIVHCVAARANATINEKKDDVMRNDVVQLLRRALVCLPFCASIRERAMPDAWAMHADINAS